MEKDTELMLDVGQANEFKLACRRAGYTNADIKRMCEGTVLATLLPVVKGLANVVMVKHLIDCDAKPFEPRCLTVAPESEQLPNRVRGQFAFDPTKINPYLSKHQKNGKVVGSNKLRKELANEPVLDANVLDYWLKNTHIIPEELKQDENGNTRYTCFWGTIYRDSLGRLYVRSLYFDDGGWGSHCHWLDSVFSGTDPAAVRASN
jgi:hypothetical protein